MNFGDLVKNFANTYLEGLKTKLKIGAGILVGFIVIIAAISGGGDGSNASAASNSEGMSSASTSGETSSGETTSGGTSSGETTSGGTSSGETTSEGTSSGETTSGGSTIVGERIEVQITGETGGTYTNGNFGHTGVIGKFHSNITGIDHYIVSQNDFDWSDCCNRGVSFAILSAYNTSPFEEKFKSKFKSVFCSARNSDI